MCVCIYVCMCAGTCHGMVEVGLVQGHLFRSGLSVSHPFRDLIRTARARRLLVPGSTTYTAAVLEPGCLLTKTRHFSGPVLCSPPSREALWRIAVKMLSLWERSWHNIRFCSSYGNECRKLTAPRPASSIESPPHGSGPSGPRPPMMLGTSLCGRHSSARRWVWRCRYSPPSPAATNARTPCAAARSTEWTFTVTTRRPARHTPVQRRRTTGPSEF
jgi:hypothetical protein